MRFCIVALVGVCNVFILTGVANPCGKSNNEALLTRELASSSIGDRLEDTYGKRKHDSQASH